MRSSGHKVVQFVVSLFVVVTFSKPYLMSALKTDWGCKVSVELKARKGHVWTKLGRIKMDCIWVNSKNVGPPFFKFTVRQFIHVSKCH